MYEEKNRKFLNSDILLLILKLVLLVIFIFIICWLFLGKKDKTLLAQNDDAFIQNLAVFKESAVEYFTTDKLPDKVGQTVKVNLGSLINQKMLLDFTNNGKKCSLTDSYAEATKTADENFALKVNLKCNKQEDFIITTIEKKNNECINCPAINDNDNNDKNNNSNQVDNSNNNQTNSQTNNQVNNQTNTQNNNQNNSQNNQSNNQNNNKIPNITNNYVKNVTYKYYNFENCGSCQSYGTETKKEKYYEVSKYSDWLDGYSNNGTAINKCEPTTTYTYCQTGNLDYLAFCFYPENLTGNSYKQSYEMHNVDAKKLEIYDYTMSAFDSMQDYENLFAKKNPETSYIAKSPAEMIYATLNPYYYTATTNGIYLSGDYYKIDIHTKLKDNFKVNYIYSDALKKSGFFITFKINVLFKIKDTCITDTLANAGKYSNYQKFDKKTTNVCKHRNKEIKWVKESELNAYLNNGWSKTGNTKEQSI